MPRAQKWVKSWLEMMYVAATKPERSTGARSQDNAGSTGTCWTCNEGYQFTGKGYTCHKMHHRSGHTHFSFLSELKKLFPGCHSSLNRESHQRGCYAKLDLMRQLLSLWQNKIQMVLYDFQVLSQQLFIQFKAGYHCISISKSIIKKCSHSYLRKLPRSLCLLFINIY